MTYTEQPIETPLQQPEANDATEPSSKSAAEHLPRVVYSPESPLRHPLRLVGRILADIWHHQELVWTLLLRDLKAQNRQAILGYLWIIIPPVMTAAVWLLLNRQNIVQVDTGDVPYAVFVLIGTTVWTVFATTVIAPLDAIHNNKEVLVKLNIPAEPLILAGVAKSVFNALVLAVVLLVVLLILGVRPAWSWCLFPLALVSALALSIMVGLLLAPAGALYQDVKNGLGPLLAILMYTAPIVFPIPREPGILQSVLVSNPLTPSVELARASLLAEPFGNWGLLLFWLLASLLSILLAFVILRVAKPHLIARMGM